MSIINQMLRELDARGAAATALPAGARQLAQKPTRSGMRMAGLGLLLLAAGGGAGVLMWSDRMNTGRQSAAPAVSTPAPVSVPVAVAPSVRDALQPDALEPAPVERTNAAAPASVPAPAVLQASQTPAVPVGQVSQPVMAAAHKPGKTAVSAPAQAEGNRANSRSLDTATVPAAPVEPAVVKKVSELTPEAEAQQYLSDAQALRRAGKTDAAIGKYRLALERSPGLRSARLQLARLLQENGQADAALSLLRAGYDQQPDGALAIATGRLMAEQGRRDEALAWLERGRESLRPPDHALMGALLSQTVRYGDAVNAYQRALASDPSQGGWWLGAGLALDSLGRIDEAKAAYRNALERGEFKPDVVKFLRQRIEPSGL